MKVFALVIIIGGLPEVIPMAFVELSRCNHFANKLNTSSDRLEGDLTYCKPVFKETLNEDVRVF